MRPNEIFFIKGMVSDQCSVKIESAISDHRKMIIESVRIEEKLISPIAFSAL